MHARLLRVGGRSRRRLGKGKRRTRRKKHKYRQGGRRKSRVKKRRFKRMTMRKRKSIYKGGVGCGSKAKITVPSQPARIAGGGDQSFNALSARGNAARATALCNSVYDGPYSGWKTIPTT